MGQSVPTMLRPRSYGTRDLAGGVLALGRRSLGPCTQCGAPDDTGAHVCGYCLSPRLTQHAAALPAMRDETFRK